MSIKSMRLSNQALGSLMLALQKSLLEQSDITEVLKEFEFVNTEDGLWIKNPPTVKFEYADVEEETE
tara:strand:- start:3618 stop:3818 length:201 start_codon:yes stop_codon:yes gene_type:complete